MALNTRDVFAHSSGARSPRSRGWQGGSLLEALREISLPCIPPRFSLFPAIHGVSWPTDTSPPRPLSLYVAAYSVCLCVCSASYKDTGCRAPQICMTLFSLIKSAKTLFPNKITFWGSRKTWILGGWFLTHCYKSHRSRASPVEGKMEA